MQLRAVPLLSNCARRSQARFQMTTGQRQAKQGQCIAIVGCTEHILAADGEQISGKIRKYWVIGQGLFWPLFWPTIDAITASPSNSSARASETSRFS